MKIGKDISVRYKDLYIVHHNMPEKGATNLIFSEHILFVPLWGEITITVNDKKYTASPGQMIYLAPEVCHSFSSSTQGGERLIAMLNLHSIDKNETPAFCVKLPISQLIKEIIFYLLLHPNTKNSESLTRVFSETLSEILKYTLFSGGLDHREGNITDPRIKNFLNNMKESIGSRITIGEIAKKTGLSTRNVNRLLLKETGMQPREWLIRFRIERAKELLKKPGISVTKVAMEIGYNSLSHFITTFQSQTGQLPSGYLKHS